MNKLIVFLTLAINITPAFAGSKTFNPVVTPKPAKWFKSSTEYQSYNEAHRSVGFVKRSFLNRATHGLIGKREEGYVNTDTNLLKSSLKFGFFGNLVGSRTSREEGSNGDIQSYIMSGSKNNHPTDGSILYLKKHGNNFIPVADYNTSNIVLYHHNNDGKVTSKSVLPAGTHWYNSVEDDLFYARKAGTTFQQGVQAEPTHVNPLYQHATHSNSSSAISDTGGSR